MKRRFTDVQGDGPDDVQQKKPTTLSAIGQLAKNFFAKNILCCICYVIIVPEN